MSCCLLLLHACRYAWYGNVNYDWDYFLVASGFSVIGMLIWMAGAALLRMCGIEGHSMSSLLRSLFVAMRCPRAFDIITGERLWAVSVLAACVRVGHSSQLWCVAA